MKQLFSIAFCCIGLSSFAQIRELTYQETVFNSDTCCWRKLSNAKQYHEGAELIVGYLAHNKYGVNRQALRWHVGQLYACAGENRLAKKYFHKTYSALSKWLGGEDGKQWYYYARGTVAFISRDKPKLERMIHKWEHKHLTKDINYRALQNLYKNWDIPYAAAN